MSQGKCYRCKYSKPALLTGYFRCPFRKSKMVTSIQEEKCKRFKEDKIWKSGKVA